MTTIIHILDHGFARLVSYMQPVPVLNEDYQDIAKEGWTGDLEVVRNARVSYDVDWRTGEDDTKDEYLVHRMTKKHHTTPFEAMVFTFEIKAPIFVLRQWHRHRTWSYNELSARYTPMKEDFYVPEPKHIGAQSKDDKQMRTISEDFPDDAMYQTLEIREMCTEAFILYKNLLESGVPRELARGVIPVNAYSRMFATVDLHNLKHFLRLRLDEHAQYEIRVYAKALLELVREVCPISIKAFEATL